ncbi:MAG: hypothetical protein WCX61_00295 [Candidatus Peribacteraceae bacterium]|jgi:hypothetical protein
MQQALFQTLQPYFEPWLLFLAQDPLLRTLQGAVLFLGMIAVFLVFFTARDIILRTNSFLLMFFCILLVALLPVVGFLLYLLLRPARTIKEREMASMVRELLESQQTTSVQQRRPKKKELKVS